MNSTTETPNIKLDVPVEGSQEPLLDQSYQSLKALVPEHPIAANQDQAQFKELPAPQVDQGGQSEPFQALLEKLKRLDQDDKQFASQAALLIGFYQRLWEAYSAKHLTNQRLEKTNQQLRTANSHLGQERDLLERRHANQEALLTYFGQAFDKVRDGIAGVLRDWDGCYVDETALPRGATGTAVLQPAHTGA